MYAYPENSARIRYVCFESVMRAESALDVSVIRFNSFTVLNPSPAGVLNYCSDRQSSDGAYQNTSQVPDEDMVLIQVWAE